MLTKLGTNQPITKIVTSAFAFDPNIITTKLKENLGATKAISLNQIHEYVKSIGIIEYRKEDMDTLVSLLQAAGITVNP